jgi:hypothetical protein
MPPKAVNTALKAPRGAIEKSDEVGLFARQQPSCEEPLNVAF